MDNFDRTWRRMWILGVLLIPVELAIVGVIVWAIIRLVLHFT